MEPDLVLRTRLVCRSDPSPFTARSGRACSRPTGFGGVEGVVGANLADRL